MSIKSWLVNGWYYTRFYCKNWFTNYFKKNQNNVIEKSGYNLIFHDEFDAPINWETWKPCEAWGCVRENAIFKQSQVTQSGSDAILTSDINDVAGEPKTKTGGLYSWNSFNTKYGYFETREKLTPNGVRYWPAFWLTSMQSWPPEIDVFELMGNDSSYITMTLHWKNGEKNEMKGRRLKFKGFDFLSKDYHIYGCEWSDKKVTWYIDNLPVYVLDKHIPDLDMFILINNCYSIHEPVKSDLPMSIYCDYIRVYKKN